MEGLTLVKDDAILDESYAGVFEWVAIEELAAERLSSGMCR